MSHEQKERTEAQGFAGDVSQGDGASGAPAGTGHEIDRYPCVEFRPQSGPHDSAAVLGNRAGLVALRRAVNKALQGEVAGEEVFASDGEGYTITARIVAPMHDAAWNETGSPYMDPIYR